MLLVGGQLEIQGHRALLLGKLVAVQLHGPRHVRAAQLGQPLGNLFARPDHNHRAAHGNHVARPDEAEMDALAVDLGAVGALQVGKDQLAVVFLDLQMEAADPLVVELDGIAFLAADGQRRGNVVEVPPAIGAVQNP